MSQPEELPGPIRQRATVQDGSQSYQAARDITIIQPRSTVDPVTGETRPVDAGRVAPPVGNIVYRLRGRTSMMVTLMTAVDASDGQVHVLAGMGGVGKTTLALACAHRAQDAGMPVWWVSATTTSTLLDGLRTVAGCLGGTVGQIDAAWDTPSSAMNLLAQLRRVHDRPFLLVIDNVDDPAMLCRQGNQPGDGTGWIRPARTGTVIITSRDTRRTTWGDWRLHPVGSLSPGDGAQVLLDLAGDRAGTRPEAEQLSHRVGGLPLALHLAGTYLATTAGAAPWPGMVRTFGQYQAALDDGLALLGSAPLGTLANSSDPRRIITRTWEISLDLLARHGQPQARNLLRLLSCYADAPLPYLGVLDPAVLSKEEYFEGVTGQTLPALLHALAGLGLVELQEPPAGEAGHPAEWTVTLHPLVRATNVTHPDVAGNPAGYPALAIRLVDALADSEQTGTPEEPPYWPWWQALAAHALHLLTWANDQQDRIDTNTLATAARATFLAGRQLRAQGAYTRAAAALEQVLDVRERVLGAKHRNTLVTRHAQALVWHAQGEYARAVAAFEQVLTDEEQVLGAEHSVTLSTRYALAVAWHAQGEHARAATEYEQVLAVRVRTLGADNLNALSTRHALAMAWHAQGEYKRAATAFEQVLADEERVLGPDHPHTLSARHELAALGQAQGDQAQAAVGYEKVIADRTRVLGAEHPDTLITRHSLAMLRYGQGKDTLAAAELEQVLAAKERVLGADHPSTQSTRSALALIRQNL